MQTEINNIKNKHTSCTLMSQVLHIYYTSLALPIYRDVTGVTKFIGRQSIVSIKLRNTHDKCFYCFIQILSSNYYPVRFQGGCITFC